MKRTILVTFILILATTGAIGQEAFGINWATITAEELQSRLDSGFDVSMRDEDGWTPLMVAALNNSNPEVIQVLVDASAEVNARDEGGWTPLIFAAVINNPEVIQVLVDAGAEVNARAEGGKTPLMFAARYNTNPDVVQNLLQADADATAENDSGQSAWNLIQENEDLKGTDVYWELNDQRFD